MRYKHLSQLLRIQAKQYGDEEVFRVEDQKSKTWSSISWNTFLEKSEFLSVALHRYGIKPQDKIGVYSQNMAECLYIDFAAFFNRAATVPLYPTASVLQLSYIIQDAGINILFAGEQLQYDNAFQALQQGTTLKQIIVLDPAVRIREEDHSTRYFSDFISTGEKTPQEWLAIETNIREGDPEEIAHLIYTSGTTGEPKGVIMTHSNYLEALRIHDIRLNYLPPRFLSVSFLPMAHIFEKAWSLYCIHRGCTIAINQDPKEIQRTIQVIKPEAMCSVPRFWEKVYAGVQEKINNSGPILKGIFMDAISTGKKYNLDYINKDKTPPLFLRLKYDFYNRTIYNILKRAVGIENGLIFPCAGAYISDKIAEFMRSVNVPLVVGYGLTETTASVSCFPPEEFEIGTVGKVMPGVDVRIGKDNEILIKGKTITRGYYNKPEATQAAFTKDGWFRTGDAGNLTKKNGIILTERIKDLYKTINGKYIAPQQLEGRLIDDKYIESAIVIGDQRKYVTALIIPDFAELEKYANRHNIPHSDIKSLISQPEIVELYNSRLQSMQHEFSHYEQIKKFTLLPEPFTISGGELTNTLKMRRTFIAEKYKELIDQMYQ